MEYSVDLINQTLGIGTLLLQIASLILIGALIGRKMSPFLSRITDYAGRSALVLGFLLTAASVFLSLFYSEILGFAPCGLCWLQRVFIYPQMILWGMAFVKNDTKIADYIIGLSIPGLIVSLYQHYLQIGGSELIPCAQTLLAADCAERTIFELGYITFPLMAGSLFVFMIALAISMKVKRV